MGIVLLDTNILIDHYNGVAEADTEIDYYDDVAISTITWVEIVVAFEARRMRGCMSNADVVLANNFLDTFPVIQTDTSIMQRAAQLRGRSLAFGPALALPDAIIRATGETTGRLIITRNIADFTGPGVRIPYELHVSHKDAGAKTNIFTPPGDIKLTVSNVAPPP